MSVELLNNLKAVTLKIKDILDDVTVSTNLQSRTNKEGQIEGTYFNYRDFLVFFNTWNTSVIAADNYLDLSPFIGSDDINTTIDAFENILNGLTGYKKNNFDLWSLNNYEAQGSFDLLKAKMLYFLPYVKGDMVKNIKEQWEFTKEKEAINTHLTDTKKLYADLNKKEKEITDFYNKLVQNNSSATGDKQGIKQLIEGSFDKIKQTYNELFVVKQTVKIGKEDVEFNGLIGKTERYIRQIEEMEKTISTSEKNIKQKEEEIEGYRIDFKRQIGDTLTEEEQKYIQGNSLKKDIKGLKQTKEEYEGYMKEQKEKINNMHLETKKSLGDHVNALMVKTFQDEARAKEIQAWLMFGFSVSFIILIAILGIYWVFSSKVSKEFEWIIFAYRAMIFLPLGLGFWFCNKRHDVCSLLAAEYRYKRSIIEAMIGYRANYETSRDQFTESFNAEYTKFFDKTFEEINKNPAEKINKMLMKNKFSVEALIDNALNAKKIEDDKSGKVIAKQQMKT